MRLDPLKPIALIQMPLIDPKTAPEYLPKLLVQDLSTTTSAEFYITVLPTPVLGPCQHLTCESWNEISMMYHPWVFSGVTLGEESQSTEVQMGIYDTFGVHKTHQTLPKAITERGIAFDQLSPRTVTLHGFRFSPCNAQMEIPNGTQECSFFALGVHKPSNKAVISYHIICMNSERETECINAAQSAKTLSEWLKFMNHAKLNEIFDA